MKEPTESSKLEPTWRKYLRLDDEAWLRDHQVQDDVVFPFAGFIAMGAEAIRQISPGNNEDGYAFRHVVVHKALILDSSQPAELFTNLRLHRLTDVSRSRWYEFSICSSHGDSWVEHCHGQVRRGGNTLPDSASRPSFDKAQSLTASRYLHQNGTNTQTI